MKKFSSILALLLSLCIFSPSAHAIKLTFGSSVELRRVDAKVKAIKGSDGAPLYLAHQITTKFFGLPYSVQSDGLVLASSPKFYADMPAPAELAMLQASGQLPDPLPRVELTWDDYLLGHSLWIVISVVLGAVGMDVLRNKRLKRAAAPAHKADEPSA